MLNTTRFRGTIETLLMILAWDISAQAQSAPKLNRPLTNRSGGQVERAWSLVGPGHRAGAVAFDADGSHLFVGYEDGSIHQYDAKYGRSLGPFLKDAHAPIRAIAYTQVGSPLAYAAPDAEPGAAPAGPGMAAGDRVTLIYPNGDIRARLSRMPGQIITLAYASDGRTIGAIDHLYNIRVWSVPDGSEVLSSAVHRANANRPVAVETRASFSADLKRAVIADEAQGQARPDSWDHLIRLWEADDKEPRFHGWRGGQKITSAVISPDGSRYATGQDDYWLTVYDFKTKKSISGSSAVFTSNMAMLPMIPKAAYLPTFLQFSPGNDFLISDSRSWSVRVNKLNVKVGSVVQELSSPDGRIEPTRAAAFVPKGIRFASGGWEPLEDQKIDGTDLPRFQPMIVWEVEVEGL